MKEIVEDSDDCINDSEILMLELQKSKEEIEAKRTIDFSDFKEKLRTTYNL